MKPQEIYVFNVDLESYFRGDVEVSKATLYYSDCTFFEDTTTYGFQIQELDIDPQLAASVSGPGLYHLFLKFSPNSKKKASVRKILRLSSNLPALDDSLISGAKEDKFLVVGWRNSVFTSSAGIKIPGRFFYLISCEDSNFIAGEYFCSERNISGVDSAPCLVECEFEVAKAYNERYKSFRTKLKLSSIEIYRTLDVDLGDDNDVA